MSELKPCPFCGGNASIDRMGTARVSMQIMCDDCGAFVETGETWIDENSHWNQRAETETEKRLTAIATKHATRADELYEALEIMVNQFSGDHYNEADYIAYKHGKQILDKSRIERS